MLNFLKQIFQKEEILEVEEVKVDELMGWLDDKLSQIDFKEEIADFFNGLKDKKWILGEKIKILETAEISEKEKDSVEEKVKNIVLGHKDNYAREMKRFLDGLEIPEEISLWESIEFNGLLDNFLDGLANRTAKSYQAAQHLFFDQVEDVFKEVGEINLLVKDFDRKSEKKGLKKIKEIREAVKFLQEDKKREERLAADLNWKEAKLSRCLEGKEKQEQEILKLRNSEEYQEFISLKEEEECIKNQVEENSDEIHSFFSKLGRALRKYERITSEPKIVKEYLEDAITAFSNDEELMIVEVLEGLGESIKKKELELDDKQKDNVLELIDGNVERHLKEILEKRKEVQKKASEIKAKLRRYNIDNLIEEADYKLEHFEEQITLVKREAEELKVKSQALGKEKLEENLKELVKEVLKIKIQLIA